MRRCPNGYPHSSATTKPGWCWTCDSQARQEACAHDGPTDSRHAGILGYRHYCAACGKRMEVDA